MSASGLSRAKQEKRKELRARIRALEPEYCLRADRAIAERLLALEAWRRARTLFCFVGRAGEIDTRPLLQAALREGKRLCVPLCTGPGLMEARQTDSLEALRPGAYGIREPDPALCPKVSPEELELILVPCLGCTREGVRLGQGGGYYDRYLAGTHAGAILLCREALVCEELPREPWDCCFDRVLTEKGLFERKEG